MSLAWVRSICLLTPFELWLTFNLCVERPIRDYERLADVFASWNKESRLNALMLKQTPLAISLARKYMPNSSPTFSGYVQWEAKKGKWQKRWLELREHSLFLSKKDNVCNTMLPPVNRHRSNPASYYRAKTPRSSVRFPTLTLMW